MLKLRSVKLRVKSNQLDSLAIHRLAISNQLQTMAYAFVYELSFNRPHTPPYRSLLVEALPSNKGAQFLLFESLLQLSEDSLYWLVVRCIWDVPDPFNV